MTIRNWIEAGILVLILVVGIIVKVHTKKKVDELDGLGKIRTKEELGDNVVMEIENDS